MSLFQKIQEGTLAWETLSSHEKNAVVKECNPKIKSILFSKGFRRYFLGIEDSYAMALMVFTQCIKSFDASKGSFWSLFNIKLNGTFVDFLRSKDFLSRNDRLLLIKIQKVKESLEKKYGQAILENISKECNEPVSEIERVLFENEHYYISLTDELANTLPDQDTVENLYLSKEYSIIFKKVLTSMLPRDKEIFTKLIDEDMTAKDISKDYNISEGRIAQIKIRIIKTIREAIPDYQLEAC